MALIMVIDPMYETVLESSPASNGSWKEWRSDGGKIRAEWMKDNSDFMNILNLTLVI